MGGNNYFVEKKKPIKNDHQTLLSRIFQGRFSAAVANCDHQLEFSQDHYNNDQSFLSKVDDSLHDDDEDDDPQEHKIFWESQEFLLQEILDQCNSNGSKLREQLKRNMETVRESNFCNCKDKNLGGCNKCLRQATINQLCSKGFSATLCTSKWKKTHKIPGGTHEYIEVIAITQGRRKQIPFLVELGFRDEFRMAKACDEYDKLVDMLPEMYAGKIEHLNAIVRVVCEAAKKSAKEKKIHMGPWRRREFMQMKWSASSEKRFLDVVTLNFQLSMAPTVEVA